MKSYLSTEIYKEFGNKINRRINKDIMIARLLYYAKKCDNYNAIEHHIIHGNIEDIEFNDEKKTFKFIRVACRNWTPIWW